MFGKTPKKTIIKAEKEKSRLRDKRSKLDPNSPNYEKNKNKINGKIHDQNVKIDVAQRELQQPVNKTTNVNTSFNYNKTEKGLHVHADFSRNKRKKK